MKSTNIQYEVGNRTYVPTVNKAIEFTPEVLAKLEEPYVRVSAELQREFGLRREEAIKFSPSFADRKTHIELKGSWTKGGRGRIIEIRTESQREAIRKAHNLAGRENLIPGLSSYKVQRRLFENHLSKAGIGNSHGARHRYAQSRYKELTGHDCKLNGGLHVESYLVKGKIGTRWQEKLLVLNWVMGVLVFLVTTEVVRN